MKKMGKMLACLLAMILMLTNAAMAAGLMRLPAALKVVGEEAFRSDDSISRVIIPSKVTEIGKRAFAESSIEEIWLNVGLQTIGEGAFEDCAKLKRITLTDGIAIVGKDTFANCTALESVVLPESIVRIESGAFAGCAGLKTINLPENVKYIAPDAFDGCDNVKISVKYGSYAYDWCEDNRIEFSTEEDWETEEF